MKRILVVSHQAHYIFGGEVVTLAFLRAFAEKPEYSFEFASPKGAYQERARELVPVHTIPAIEFSRKLSLLPAFLMSFGRTLANLVRIIREKKIDIVHANTLKAMVYCWPLGFFRLVPVLWHHHDILPESRRNFLWLYILSLAAKKIITPSLAARDALLLAGIPAEKVTAIWNGFDPNEWKARPHLQWEKSFVVGFVGEISPRKGADLLVPILRSLENAMPGKFRLQIVGTSLSDPLFADQVKKSGTDLVERNLLEFLGRREDVQTLLQGMDVLLVPSRQDPFPTVVLEAAFSGVPVIANHVGGIPEMLRHGETGFFAASVDDYAARIRFLSESRESWKKIGHCARSYAEENFSVARMVEKLCLVYEG